METRIARIAPLVDELQRFVHGHERGDRAAASKMLAHLRLSWPEIPDGGVGSDPIDDRDAEELVLGIISDVGEVAAALGAASDREGKLPWSGANLVHDLERYACVALGD